MLSRNAETQQRLNRYLFCFPFNYIIKLRRILLAVNPSFSGSTMAGGAPYATGPPLPNGEQYGAMELPTQVNVGDNPSGPANTQLYFPHVQRPLKSHTNTSPAATSSSHPRKAPIPLQSSTANGAASPSPPNPPPSPPASPSTNASTTYKSPTSNGTNSAKNSYPPPNSHSKKMQRHGLQV